MHLSTLALVDSYLLEILYVKNPVKVRLLACCNAVSILLRQVRSLAVYKKLFTLTS